MRRLLKAQFRRLRDRFAPPHLPATLNYISPLEFRRIAAGDLWTAQGLAVASSGAERRAVVRPGPLFHDDPDGAHLFPDLKAETFLVPPPFVVGAENVTLIGMRSYVAADGRFFNDESYPDFGMFAVFRRALASGDWRGSEFTGVNAAGAEGPLALDRRNRPLRRWRDPVLSLASLEYGQYGSFLFRLLPKLAGLPALPPDCRVLTPPLRATMRDLLELAGLDRARLVEQREDTAERLDRAVIPSMRLTHGLVDDETRALYARLRERCADGRTGRRIFVSRRGWAPHLVAQRPLLNEAELEPALEAIGFEIVRPHEMTMRQQIACFAAADVVAGMAGSGLFNCLFCRPGTIVVDIESEPHWLHLHQNLFGSAGLRYGIVEARAADRDWSVPHKPVTVNIPALVRRLTQLPA